MQMAHPFGLDEIRDASIEVHLPLVLAIKDGETSSISASMRCRVPTCGRAEGAICAFPDFSSLGVPSSELAADILERGPVATEAGAFYGASGEGHLRICFGTEPYERLEAALDRIEAYLGEVVA